MKQIRAQLKRGYTLLEITISVSILSLVLVVALSTLSIFVRSYQSIQAVGRIDSSATVALERITREIRHASSIDYINTTLTTHPGRLVLNSVYNGSTTTIDFYFDNGVLKMKRGGVEIGALTRKNVTVDNLIFYVSSNALSSIIRTDIDLAISVRGATTSATFYSSTVLRGAY